ncbi:MYCBP-associated protein isoform X3 [Echinops telfairi]|uniref:MYCBP-associated protein isoform X3 n=1 Tax=Echinops telfairi TaxID=9371 RepID=A0AC55DVF0_ECHTE|nr:MYCBP-associated protein isoform X3 [Echinops telfairi]
MKAQKKESRVRVPTNKLSETSETSSKEKKRAKLPEQPTPPIQEEPEPISNVLQGDDILALAITKEDLKKQHVPCLEMGKPTVTKNVLIRKFKPQDTSRKVCHLVAHPATPEVATKPLDYSGSGDIFDGSMPILPHHILGSLQDLKRVALARGNTQLANLIQTPPCLMTLLLEGEEPKPKKSPQAKKAHLWAPAAQHNFLKNWRRNLALRKKQQEALSGHLGKPVSKLLMHSGETYRQIREEREHIDRALLTQHDGKCQAESSGFWSRVEYVGDEMTGLVMTKTKAQRGILEPIPRIRKPHSVREEMGLLAQEDSWYRYTWDRSLFLIYRRKELQSILAELDFSKQDIDGLEVVGRGQPFSSVTVEDYMVFDNTWETSSEDSLNLDLPTIHPDMLPMPVLGPSLLFCGKPACWIRSRNAQDKSQVGIAARLVFETLEGETTSSALTVVNNGTVAIWYTWRRQVQQHSFQDLKRNRVQRFYFNNRPGVILPGETKTFTFFFKSLNAGIFRESWEFGTHPALLGGALLQVNLYAISLTQDVFKEERKLLKSKLTAQEAVTIVDSVLQEMLRGILTPERAPSPADANLTEEDLFHYKNPQLHYQHQVVQTLLGLWQQYLSLPPSAEEAQPGPAQAAVSTDPSAHLKVPAVEIQVSQPENEAPRESTTLQMFRGAAGPVHRKSIMDEILVQEGPDLESTRTPRELESPPPAAWNLCLEDLRKAVITLPEESQREDALVTLNRGALELCQKQRPLQSNFLQQTCLQLWRDVIDSMVSYSLWLRALLGLPEKETMYLDVPDEQVDQKPPPIVEAKTATGKVGKEERKGAAQEKKQLGIKDKEDKKSAKPGKEDRANSKKLKPKDDKKLIKSTSRDRLSLEDTIPEITTPSQEPIDPLVMEKYLHRLHLEVYGLLDALVTTMMVLADELTPMKNVE